MVKVEQSNRFGRLLVRYSLYLGLMAFLIWQTYFTGIVGPHKPDNERLSYSSLIEQVQAGNIQNITIQNDLARGTTRDGLVFRATVQPNDTYLMNLLVQNHVVVNIKEAKYNTINSMLSQWLPALIIIPLLLLYRNRIQKRFAKTESKN